MSKKKEITEKPPERIIHIKAESKYISVNALVPEKKADGVLIDIRNNFSNMKWRFDKKGNEVLKVQTCVHNPTMF